MFVVFFYHKEKKWCKIVFFFQVEKLFFVTIAKNHIRGSLMKDDILSKSLYMRVVVFYER